MTNEAYPTQIDFGTFEEELEDLDRTIPAGTYDMEFAKYSYRDSKAGNPRVILTFQIIGEEDPKVNGARIFHNIGFSRDDVFFMRAILALAKDDAPKLHLDLDDIRNGRSGNYEGGQMGLSDMYKRVVTGVVVVRTVDGIDRNNIQEFEDLKRS